MLIDTHAHIEKKYYPDLNQMLTDAKKLGISKIISAGTDDLTNKEAILLSEKYPEIYASVGIHPEFSCIYQDSDLKKLTEYAASPKVVAIGEIGLDYHYEDYDKNKQIELFEKQLAIAQKLNLPVVIHSRDAINDTILTLQKYPGVKGVIHAFSGSKESGQILINLGYKLGVGGVVTFKNAKTKEVVKALGIENYVLETDSPFLSPDPFRGKQNFPGNTIYVAKYLANYLAIPLEEILNITTQNAFAIFDKLQ